MLLVKQLKKWKDMAVQKASKPSANIFKGLFPLR